MKYILALLSTFIIFLAFPKDMIQGVDTVKNIIDKTKIHIKLSDAKHKFYQNNYRSALNSFKEVLVVDKNNSKANFGIAQCQFALKKYDKAKTYVEKAFKANSNTDPDIQYLMGNIYHRLEEFDLAENSLKKFKENVKEGKAKEYDVDLIINQINYGRSAIKNPTNVKIENMGESINTKSPEFAPCISQDGKYMVFTSRRADTRGGAIDIYFDYMYYSDIYLCKWDDNMKKWDNPKNILGKVNTEYHDGGLGFTSNNALLIYRNIYNVTKSGDIYISQLARSGDWATPKPIAHKDKKISKKINSSYFESSASITADDNYIYFVSERPGGSGQADIYYVKKSGKSYTEPQNLGPNINTAGDEKCVFIHPSGKFLFFTSNGIKESVGSYDIYYCTGGHGNWSSPINIGYPINTVLEEKTISVSSDGKTAYVGGYYNINSQGDADIFKIDISSLNLTLD